MGAGAKGTGGVCDYALRLVPAQTPHTTRALPFPRNSKAPRPFQSPSGPMSVKGQLALESAPVFGRGGVDQPTRIQAT
jgi:hypothetical protein